MRAGIERAVRDDTEQRVEEMARLGEIDLLAKRVQPVDLVNRKQLIDRQIEQFGEGLTEQARQVAGRLEDTKRFAFENQHRAMRQDCPWNMDRFAVTICQIDAVARLDDVTHDACSIPRAIARKS